MDSIIRHMRTVTTGVNRAASNRSRLVSRYYTVDSPETS